MEKLKRKPFSSPESVKAVRWKGWKGFKEKVSFEWVLADSFYVRLSSMHAVRLISQTGSIVSCIICDCWLVAFKNSGA